MFETFTFDWEQVIVDLLRVVIAFILAVPIGWERSRSTRHIGLRTFPLVAIASCGYMLIFLLLRLLTPMVSVDQVEESEKSKADDC